MLVQDAELQASLLQNQHCARAFFVWMSASCAIMRFFPSSRAAIRLRRLLALEERFSTLSCNIVFDVDLRGFDGPFLFSHWPFPWQEVPCLYLWLQQDYHSEEILPCPCFTLSSSSRDQWSVCRAPLGLFVVHKVPLNHQFHSQMECVSCSLRCRPSSHWTWSCRPYLLAHEDRRAHPHLQDAQHWRYQPSLQPMPSLLTIGSTNRLVMTKLTSQEDINSIVIFQNQKDLARLLPLLLKYGFHGLPLDPLFLSDSIPCLLLIFVIMWLSKLCWERARRSSIGISGVGHYYFRCLEHSVQQQQASRKRKQPNFGAHI